MKAKELRKYSSFVYFSFNRVFVCLFFYIIFLFRSPGCVVATYHRVASSFTNITQVARITQHPVVGFDMAIVGLMLLKVEASPLANLSVYADSCTVV